VNGERARDRFMPWGGLALGTVGFFVAHQLGGDSVFQDCSFSSPLVVAIATLLALLLIGAGALISFRVYASDAEPRARKLVAIISLLACMLYTMGVILPLIAAMIIPRCWE
jgi:hypothetical protein